MALTWGCPLAYIVKKADSFYCQFYYLGKRHTVTVGPVDKAEAEAFGGKVDYFLLRLKQKLIQLPAGVSISDFIASDGKVVPVESATAPLEPISFSAFQQKYIETHRQGAMEENSLATVDMHLRHFARTLGEKYPLQQLQLGDLQRHVNERAKKTYRGKKLSTATLRKEIASFRAAWNWAVLSNLVGGTFPSKGLVFPKADEKLPFMTWSEIERRLARGGITKEVEAELWEALYLRRSEIDELLVHTKEGGTQPWVYPLLCTAAHTGARRSELLRIQISDVDFEGKMILIHEKKRSRQRRTTRHVSLSPFLANVLQEWLTVHPGGPHLFAQMPEVARSRTRSKTTGHQTGANRPSTGGERKATVRTRASQGILPLTRNEAHDHLKRTLAGSKWAVLRGYHVLRHSFISCMAAEGIDQRIIDDFVGHQTDDQRRRYRHLVPDVKHDAMKQVFG